MIATIIQQTPDMIMKQRDVLMTLILESKSCSDNEISMHFNDVAKMNSENASLSNIREEVEIGIKKVTGLFTEFDHSLHRRDPFITYTDLKEICEWQVHNYFCPFHHDDFITKHCEYRGTFLNADLSWNIMLFRDIFQSGGWKVSLKFLPREFSWNNDIPAIIAQKSTRYLDLFSSWNFFALDRFQIVHLLYGVEKIIKQAEILKKVLSIKDEFFFIQK